MFEIVNNGSLAAPSYASTPTILASFNGINGADPLGSLIADANGDLFEYQLPTPSRLRPP